MLRALVLYLASALPTGAADYDGWYAGAAATASFGHVSANWFNPPSSGEDDHEIAGFTGSGFLGFQRQRNNLVVGAEIGLSLGTQRGDDNYSYGLENSTFIKNGGYVSGRLGVRRGTDLVFATLGWTERNGQVADRAAPGPYDSIADVRFSGPRVSVGVELDNGPALFRAEVVHTFYRAGYARMTSYDYDLYTKPQVTEFSVGYVIQF